MLCKTTSFVNEMKKYTFVWTFFFNFTSSFSSLSFEYMSLQRPVVEYVNGKYARNVYITERRVSREDPRYYINIGLESLLTFGNNGKIDFYFYQFTTNRYQPSFVEFHFKFCDMVQSDMFFGVLLKSTLDKMNLTCPYPPGVYSYPDLLIPYVPKNFPFKKGRLYLNVSIISKHGIDFAGSAHMDMEIKRMTKKQ
ncbi:uncharacterized protein LOC142986733 [Anticarsia gemmatalis]|uniref:uncharacterized protein LOC142986733 n=1 Tax=Anticarsia gemmatalis TaxID=129554 RepID=UPI003F771E02